MTRSLTPSQEIVVPGLDVASDPSEKPTTAHNPWHCWAAGKAHIVGLILAVQVHLELEVQYMQI